MVFMIVFQKFQIIIENFRFFFFYFYFMFIKYNASEQK